MRILHVLLLAWLAMPTLYGSIFVYAPGLAAPIWFSYSRGLDHTCRALRNLHIFSSEQNVYTDFDENTRIGTIVDADNEHIVYVPLFLDYNPNSSISEWHIAQNRDIADLLYAFSYAVTHHNKPVHCLGHSRGAAAVGVCMGLIWHDPAYLEHLIAQYWNTPRSDVLPEGQLPDIIGTHTGALCLMEAFDNLPETISNMINSLAIPRSLRRRIVQDPKWLYDVIGSAIPLPAYDWNYIYTLRNVIQHIPAHVPCVFLHAEQDAINPSSVCLDLYKTRSLYAQHRSNFFMLHNSTLCALAGYIGIFSLAHIEYPYLRAVPEAGATFKQYVDLCDNKSKSENAMYSFT